MKHARFLKQHFKYIWSNFEMRVTPMEKYTKSDRRENARLLKHHLKWIWSTFRINLKYMWQIMISNIVWTCCMCWYIVLLIHCIVQCGGHCGVSSNNNAGSSNSLNNGAAVALVAVVVILTIKRMGWRAGPIMQGYVFYNWRFCL